jgi:pimeloyl-ACP methyl ester carboxylesterase
MTAPAVEQILTTQFFNCAARIWGDGLPVLGLHGWLDNAASFDPVAPLLSGIQLVAIDLPGHGWSDHRPPGMKYHYVDYIDDVIAVADALKWPQFLLLGHSLGAGIASMIAGAFPDRITGLMLIEGLGPMSRPPDQTPVYLSRSVSQRQRQQQRPPTVYSDLETIVAARQKAGGLMTAAAWTLTQRSVKRVENGYTWYSDPRLKISSPFYMTEEQVLAVLGRISCPTLLLIGERGLLTAGTKEKMAGRIAGIADIETVVLPGGHHLHMDHPESVAAAIRNFVTSHHRRFAEHHPSE